MTRAFLRTILCFVLVAAGWRAADSAWASDLERIDNARLVEDGVNDGDSFLVAAGKTRDSRILSLRPC